MLGLRGADHRGMVHSEEELKMLVTASQEAGVLEEQEEQMLHRVFGFADLTAGQVMIPRTELVAVAADTPLRDLLRKIGQGEPTRLPVYRDRSRRCDRDAARGRSGEGAGRPATPTSTPARWRAKC